MKKCQGLVIGSESATSKETFAEHDIGSGTDRASGGSAVMVEAAKVVVGKRDNEGSHYYNGHLPFQSFG
jgi:hypothetical protein